MKVYVYIRLFYKCPLAELSKIAKNWKQNKGPPIDEELRSRDTIEYESTKKRNEISVFGVYRLV